MRDKYFEVNWVVRMDCRVAVAPRNDEKMVGFR